MMSNALSEDVPNDVSHPPGTFYSFLLTPKLKNLVMDRNVSSFCTPLPPVFPDVKLPEPLASEDYVEFCGLMKPYTEDDCINMMFTELFTTDSEGHITGLTGNIENPSLRSAIGDYYEDMILDALQCVGLHDQRPAYPRLLPWVESIREALSARHTRREDDPSRSRYGLAVRSLCRAYTMGGHKMAYPEALIRAAIENNFDDSDPRKAILLKCTPHGRPSEHTEMSKWKNWGHLDCRKEFTPESVAGMKPALLAYLEDLKDLGEIG